MKTTLQRHSNGRKMRPLLSPLELRDYQALVITTIIYKTSARIKLVTKVTNMILGQQVESISCKMNKLDQETWEVSHLFQ